MTSFTSSNHAFDLENASSRDDNGGIAESQNPRPRKRQKIALACDECRARKVRCDGVRPHCGACRRKNDGRQCHYPSEHSRTSNDKYVIQDLRQRLAQLEGRLNESTSTERVSEDHNQDADEQRNSEVLPFSQSTVREPAPAPVLDLSQECEPLQPPNTFFDGHQQADRTLSPPMISEHRLSMPQSYSSAPSRPVANVASGEPRIDEENVEDDEGSINAMGMACVSPETTMSNRGEFYGTSSAASFLNDIQGRLSGKPRSPNSANRPIAPGQMLDRIAAGSLQHTFAVGSVSKMDDYHLPPRHLADHLLDLYWSRVHCLYPYLHWPTLLEAYRRLWMSDAEVRKCPQLSGTGIGGTSCSIPVFYSALNAIFAQGSAFLDRSAEERKEISRPFWRRARHLLRLDFLDRGDLSLVQALLVMAHCLQCTNLPTRCWNVAGVAYRMAQGLGLHLEISDERKSPQYREIGRRVWHACVCLDVILGMTLGRPSLSYQESTVALPTPLEDELPNAATESPSKEATNPYFSAVAFFSATIKLYKILATILRQIYDPWKAAHRDVDGDGVKDYANHISSLLSLVSELDRLQEGFPALLRMSSDSHENLEGDFLMRERNVLHTRFLHTRVLLYRPLFVQLCQRSISNSHAKSSSGAVSVAEESISTIKRLHKRSIGEDELFLCFAQRCSVACVEAAQELIKHIDTTSQTSATGAPWFNCYYVYHAAMILTLAQFYPSIREKLNENSLVHCRQRCLDYFHRTTSHYPEASRYLKALQEISQDVYANTEERNNSGSGSETRPAPGGRQNQNMAAITNPCLDPSMPPWLMGDLRIDALAQLCDIDFGLDPYKDESMTFSTSNPLDINQSNGNLDFWF